MTATKAYSTSQKSPHYTCVNSRRNPSSTYQHMFLEDFCDGFSFELAQDKDDRLFYDVTPEGTQLKKLLTFQKYDFLRYDMDRLFSHIMRTLVFSGKAFLEIVKTMDSDKNVIGISLVPFDPILSWRCSSSTYFLSIQKDKKIRFFKIDNRDLVLLKLSDLGFWRYYFKFHYRRISHLDVLKMSGMSLVSQNAGFDFTVWKDNREFQLLKLSRKIGWFGRNTSNQYMGEAYLLYRTIQLRSLKKRFLDYFLAQINASLKPICSELKIEGKLFAKCISHDYDDLLQKLQAGELNYSQLGDYVFPRIQ